MNVNRAIDLPTAAEVRANQTCKQDLAKLVYPDTTYDTALPQDWVNAKVRQGFDPRPVVVWGYPKGSIFGLPLPLTVEAEAELKRMRVSG